MIKNMGKMDRKLRVLIAILVAVLYFMGVITGTLTIVLLILAVIFVVTSFVNFCPLYLLFGISTRPKNQEKKDWNPYLRKGQGQC